MSLTLAEVLALKPAADVPITLNGEATGEVLYGCNDPECGRWSADPPWTRHYHKGQA